MDVAPLFVLSGVFRQVPTPLVLHIFSHLNLDDLVQVSLVCRKFHRESETTARYLLAFIAHRNLRPGILPEIVENVDRKYYRALGEAAGKRMAQWKLALRSVNFPHDRVLLLGGQGGAQQVQLFRPQRLTHDPNSVRAAWEECDSMKYPRQCFTTAWYRGEVFAISGDQTYPDCVGRVEKFSPFSGRWEEVAPLPVRLACVAVAVYDPPRPYTCGGRGRDGRSEAGEYVSNALPHCSQLYVIGGYNVDSQSISNAIYRLDELTTGSAAAFSVSVDEPVQVAVNYRWVEVDTVLSTPRMFHSAVGYARNGLAAGSSCIVSAGGGVGGFTTSVGVWWLRGGPDSETKEDGTRENEAINQPSAASVATTATLPPAAEGKKFLYRFGADLMQHRSGFALLQAYGRHSRGYSLQGDALHLYAVGGDVHSQFNTLESYDPAAHRWTVTATIPGGRRLCCSSAVTVPFGGGVTSLIYVLGGCDEFSAEPIGSWDVFNVQTGQWNATWDVLLGGGLPEVAAAASVGVTLPLSTSSADFRPESAESESESDDDSVTNDGLSLYRLLGGREASLRSQAITLQGCAYGCLSGWRDFSVLSAWE